MIINLLNASEKSVNFFHSFYSFVANRKIFGPVFFFQFTKASLADVHLPFKSDGQCRFNMGICGVCIGLD